MNNQYWNPILETLGKEGLRVLQLRKFKRIFKWAREKSKFHRALYDEAGIKPEDIRSFEDIYKVPKVEKFMMRDHRPARIPAGHVTRLGVVGEGNFEAVMNILGGGVR
jgi:phenylacetate-coenzyme A ligase PaaK-like adenylate-forming protein